MGGRMKWLDTPSAGRSGFAQSRLIVEELTIVEIAKYGATYWVEFTRFAPKEARDLGTREFLTLEDAKVWAVAMVRLS